MKFDLDFVFGHENVKSFLLIKFHVYRICLNLMNEENINQFLISDCGLRRLEEMVARSREPSAMTFATNGNKNFLFFLIQLKLLGRIIVEAQQLPVFFWGGIFSTCRGITYADIIRTTTAQQIRK